MCVLCLGWTPSTFVSSRQQKQTATGQRPEDFMDEEVSLIYQVPCVNAFLKEQKGARIAQVVVYWACCSV